MEELNLKVEGMSCQHCVKSVEMEITKLPIESWQVEIGSVRVSFDKSKVRANEIENAIREAGYQIVK